MSRDELIIAMIKVAAFLIVVNIVLKIILILYLNKHIKVFLDFIENSPAIPGAPPVPGTF